MKLAANCNKKSDFLKGTIIFNVHLSFLVINSFLVLNKNKIILKNVIGVYRKPGMEWNGI